LSIAEAEPATPVRRLPILLAAAVGVATIGVLTVATVRWVGRHESATTSQAAGSAGHALTLLVDAESGRDGVCRSWADYVMGLRRDLLQECQALADRDPGARLEEVHEDPPALTSTAGTVTVHATLVDDHGRRALTREVRVVAVNGRWRMSWDGRPVV
jgi:hypothetical protein